MLRHRFETMDHESGKRHAGETGRADRIVPTAAEVVSGIGERIHDIFHDAVEEDDYREHGVKMTPAPGTVSHTK